MEDLRSCAEAWPSSPVSEGLSMHVLMVFLAAFAAAILLIKVHSDIIECRDS